MITEPEEFPVLEAENINIGSCHAMRPTGALDDWDNPVHEVVPNCSRIGMWIGLTFGSSTFGEPTSHVPFTVFLKEELEKRGIWNRLGFAETNDAAQNASPEEQLKHKQLLADAWNAAGFRYGYTESA